MDNSHVSSAQPAGKHHTPRILTVMNLMVLVLSGLLIFFISVDTFEEVNFLENHQYMVFQFWVCIFFMIDFFVELAYTSDKLCFVKRRMAFLLLSVPYLNIINMTGMHLSGDVLYFVRFIPPCARSPGHVNSHRLPVEQRRHEPVYVISRDTADDYLLLLTHIFRHGAAL